MASDASLPARLREARDRSPAVRSLMCEAADLIDKLDPPEMYEHEQDAARRAAPEMLRHGARFVVPDERPHLCHAMRLAADALEAFEAVDRDRLEHEAVTAEEVADLPLFPMRQDYLGERAYTDAVVAWVRTATATEPSSPPGEGNGVHATDQAPPGEGSS